MGGNQLWGCLILLDTVQAVSKGTRLPAARAFSVPNPEPGRREQREGQPVAGPGTTRNSGLG